MASCTYNPKINSVNPYAVLNVTQQSQNVASNSSTVLWELLLYRPSSIVSSASKSWSINVNGTTKSGETTIGGSGTKSIASGTVTVPHNADGTKSISFSFSLEFGINWAGKQIETGSASGSMTLSTIPRATTPTLNPTVINMGETMQISLPRASNSFTHTLQHDFYVGSWTTFATGATTSASLLIPLDWASIGNMVNQTSGGGRIRCITYNGSTVVGEKIVNFTANVPSSVVPTISSVSVEEASSLPIQSFGFVQSESMLRCQIQASGAYGSTIKSYSSFVGSIPYSGQEFTTGTISQSGELTIRTTVTDSRGRTATYETSVQVMPYSIPVVTMTISRGNEFGEDDGEGDFAIATVDVEITPLGNENENSYKIEYKQDIEEEWVIAKIGSGYSIHEKMNLGEILSAEFSYNFRITVTDSFGSVVFNTSSVPTAFTPVNFNSSGKGIAFGKISIFDMLEIAMETLFYSTISIKNKIAMLFEDSSGEYIEVMQMNDDTFQIGKGGYDKSTGKTVIYGNRIEFESKNGLYSSGNQIGIKKEFEYDETNTGDTWLGKEIYQKVIDAGSLSSQSKVIAHGITNVDTIWADVSNSFLIAPSGITYTNPRVPSANSNQVVTLRVDKTNLYVDVGSDANFSKCYVTLRYTKS